MRAKSTQFEPEVQADDPQRTANQCDREITQKDHTCYVRSASAATQWNLLQENTGIRLAALFCMD